MEDSQIIELYFARNEAAITETNSKYGEYCHAIARNILLSQRDAEECVNDTWLRTWNAIPPKRPNVLRQFLAKITRNGKLDLSLWEKDGWNESKKWAQQATADPEGNYPGRVDRSVKDSKRAIIEQAEQFKREGKYTFYTKLLTMEDFNWKEAEEVFEYVKPFENGTFRQKLSIDSSTGGEYRGTNLYYERTINGFSTNDAVSIHQSFNGNHREVCRIGPQFTEDDLQNLPDLVSVINNLDEYLPETYKGEDISEHFCGVTGHYAKVDNQIYGVVTIAWGNPKWEEPKGPTCIVGMRVYEYTRILVLQDGTKRIVTEEELKSYIG